MAGVIRAFETITLQVADLGRSLLFYTNILGLKFPERSQRSASAMIGGVRLLLHEDFDATLKGSRRGAGSPRGRSGCTPAGPGSDGSRS